MDDQRGKTPAGAWLQSVSRRTWLGGLAGTWLAAPAVAAGRRRADHEPPARVTGRSAWREIGDTTFATFEAEFARFESPMLAEAAAIYRRVRGHSCLYLAMSFHEKKHDTYLEFIPAHFHNAMAMKAADGSGRWRRYPRYEAGAADWVKRLTSPTGPYAHTTTLRQLIMIYAPPFENDTRHYVRTVAHHINRYPRLPLVEEDGDAADSTSSQAEND
jgi:hypothetical protein